MTEWIKEPKGVAYWAAFYRKNPQRFVKEYLNISLKLFQKILIYMMIRVNEMEIILDYILCFFIKRLPPCWIERWLIRALMRIRED